MFQFFSFVFNWLKSQVARVRFELARRAYIKAKRRIECADKVCDIPHEFGGGKLYMDNVGKFFVVQYNNSVFNVKIENLTHDEAADLAFCSSFNHIDLGRNGIENTIAYTVAERNYCHFFGNGNFRHYLGQVA